MTEKTVTLDGRDDIRNGREPFSKIMKTVLCLKPGEKFLLRAPFEPVPLFAILARRGFNHSARQNDCGDWEVLFKRNGKANSENCEDGKPPSAKKSGIPDPRSAILVHIYLAAFHERPGRILRENHET